MHNKSKGCYVYYYAVAWSKSETTAKWIDGKYMVFSEEKAARLFYEWLIVNGYAAEIDKDWQFACI